MISNLRPPWRPWRLLPVPRVAALSMANPFPKPPENGNDTDFWKEGVNVSRETVDSTPHTSFFFCAQCAC